jgi:glutamyl-tRNA synthetase
MPKRQRHDTGQCPYHPVPHFAHLPMILGTDRSKLSKRHGAASTLEYRKMGYIPEAMINFLVRLGWSHGDQEIFTIAELQKYFALDHIGKANAVFNPEKLSWISGQILKDYPSDKLTTYLKKYFSEELSFLKGTPDSSLEKGVAIIQAKVKNLLEMIEQLEVLFGNDPTYDKAHFKSEDLPKQLQLWKGLQTELEKTSFVKAELETHVKGWAAGIGEKFPAIAQSLRFAVTGGKVSPGLFEMLEVQGKERVLRRIGLALKALES